MPHTDRRRMTGLVAATLILGVAIGVGAGLLTLLLYGVEHVMLGYVETETLPGPFTVPAWRRALSVTVGLALAGLAWWLLRTKSTKVPSVKKAVEGERMPVWQTVAHVLLQIFIVGSGASIGREVAPRELGAMLAQRCCDLLRIEGEHGVDRRMMVAVAAGAGLGGVYNAPLAGMFFTVEMLLADVTLEKVALSLGMSSVAAFTAGLVKGRHVFYDVTPVWGDDASMMLPFALLAGLACGVAGAWFRRASQRAGAKAPKDARILWMMPLAGVFTGTAALLVPQVMGNGRAAAQLGFAACVPGAGVGMTDGSGPGGASSAWGLLDGIVRAVSGTSSPCGDTGGGTLSDEAAWHGMAVVAAVLAVTFAAKAAATLLTIRAGASGGVLQPGIALGATLGALLGSAWTAALPMLPSGSLAACALIGAAALLSASQQAPLMAMCLVIELTEAPMGFFVPVGVAVAASVLASRWVSDVCGRRKESPTVR